MKRPRSAQDWILWLENGAGGKWIAIAALLLGIGLLSGLVAYKRFRGPITEHTLAQAVVGRQLAAGEGFTTLINYPQSVAVLRARGGFDVRTTRPADLHHAPLYPLTIAAALRVLPESRRAALLTRIPTPPEGFGGDYVLLALNIVLLWVAAAQTFFLGRRLFDASVGLLATLALLASVSIWGEAVAVNGTALTMVLALALFQVLARLDEALVADRAPWLSCAGVGIVGGLLALADYSAAIVLPVALGWLAWRARGRDRALGIALVVGAFALVAAPWILRNVALTGHPLALAGQGVALKAGDPTAEPAVVRATFSAASPTIDLRKLGNKGLTGLQKALQEKIWSGGGFLLTAFFVSGLLYRFRNDQTNRLRWLFVAVFVAAVGAQAFFDSGEGERFPVVYAAPLVMIFGAGFFAVLVASSETLANHPRFVAAVLLLLQALPLGRDLLGPRGWHFNYPPYYPPLFVGLRDDIDRRAQAQGTWMADVPAGAAWYSGKPVWAQPATLREFYRVSSDQAVFALVLTPRTLDRPFFFELANRPDTTGAFGDWAHVYAGLLTGRFPPNFPLNTPQKLLANLYVLVDPAAFPAAPASGK